MPLHLNNKTAMFTETKKLNAYERVSRHLFEDKENTALKEEDFRIKRRLQAAFLIKTQNPAIQDKQLVRYLVQNFGVSVATAYNDLNAVEGIVANMRQNSKPYIRTLVSENLKRIIQIELDRLEDVAHHNEHAPSSESKMMYSTAALTQALNVLARSSNLDKEEPNLPDWDNVQPPIIEPTDDITTIDLEPVPSDTIERLKEKYMGKMQQIAQKADA